MTESPGTLVNAPARSLGQQAGAPAWVSQVFLLERHLGALVAVLFVPLNTSLALLCLASYCVRMWGLEACYHRYFSHRAFKTSRAGQVVLALIGAQTGQRGALYWSCVHRLHHRQADTARDFFSPITNSFWFAYGGWIRRPENLITHLDVVPDLAKYPELLWLNRMQHVIMLATALLIMAAGHAGWLGPDVDGWSALAWGYFVPVTLVTHSVLLINTLCHLPRFPGGYRRYETNDHSVNRHVLSFLTLGAGYHNNHHRVASLARSGFAWYEFDLTYYSLLLLQSLGLVWDVKGKVPEDVAREGGLTGGEA